MDLCMESIIFSWHTYYRQILGYPTSLPRCLPLRFVPTWGFNVTPPEDSKKIVNHSFRSCYGNIQSVFCSTKICQFARAASSSYSVCFQVWEWVSFKKEFLSAVTKRFLNHVEDDDVSQQIPRSEPNDPMKCDSYWSNNAFRSSQSSSNLRINQSYMSNFPSASRQVVENYNWTPLALKKRFNSCQYISNNIFTYIGLAPRVSSSRCRCLLLIAIRLD